MRQILFEIPLWIPFVGWRDFPLFGFGTMLVLAYFGCMWLCTRLGRRVGIAPEVFKDLVLGLFITGIIGARIAYFLFEAKERSLLQFLTIWDGGLVFYGSIFGALVGFFFIDRALQRKHPYDRWKLADCVAPCVALGLALGRVGCLLNGCCYGEVACAHCLAISFPLSGAPRVTLVDRGVQTTAGFTLDRDMQRKVDFVEPGSKAATAGLKAGDLITQVNGKNIVDVDINGKEFFGKLHDSFRGGWPRGTNQLLLTVQSPDGQTRELPAFDPWTVGLHPTQIYETISMILMLFFLLSYFPYRKADGELMVILMFGYAIHRFLNEMLRSDNEILADGLTLSQNISILVFVAAIILAIAVYWHARRNSLNPANEERERPEEATRLASGQE